MYMVIALAGNDPHLGGGLTLTEAFNRIMALADCDCCFHRVDGVMHLALHHRDGVPDEYQEDPDLRAQYFPDYRSTLCDDAVARADIMRSLLSFGFKGYLGIPANHRGGLTGRDLRRLEHATP